MQLRVRFRGLCHFVKMFSDQPAGQQLDKVLALLVDGRNPTPPLPPARHFPFVRYRLRHVAPGAPADAFGLWPLHGTDLQILDDNGDATLGGQGLRLKTVRTETNHPQTADEESSVHWLFDMAALGFGRVPDAAVTDQLTEVLPAITTRVAIAGGELSTAAVVKEQDNRTPVRFQFVQGETGRRLQNIEPVAMSEEMLLSAEVRPGKVRLERIGRRSGNSNFLELSAVDGAIELSILNLELDSILGNPRRGVPPPLVDEFAWFYGLFDPGAMGTNANPLPEAVEQLRDDNPYCPQTQSSRTR